jgi:hypothetical protein
MIVDETTGVLDTGQESTSFSSNAVDVDDPYKVQSLHVNLTYSLVAGRRTQVLEVTLEGTTMEVQVAVPVQPCVGHAAIAAWIWTTHVCVDVHVQTVGSLAL